MALASLRKKRRCFNAEERKNPKRDFALVITSNVLKLLFFDASKPIVAGAAL